MTGEQVLSTIWHTKRSHQSTHTGMPPRFLYISYQEFYLLKQTDEFVNQNAHTYVYDEPQPFVIFGMEIVRVDKRDNFIRVGN